MSSYPILAAFRPAVALAALCFASSAARAQTAPTPTTPAAADKTKEEAVQLSPFEVRPEDDSGYQAANTTVMIHNNPAARPTRRQFIPPSLLPIKASRLLHVGLTASRRPRHHGFPPP